MLNEQDRLKLDSVVAQMETNGEDENYIRSVVEDFKSKYDRQPQQQTQQIPKGLQGDFSKAIIQPQQPQDPRYPNLKKTSSSPLDALTAYGNIIPIAIDRMAGYKDSKLTDPQVFSDFAKPISEPIAKVGRALGETRGQMNYYQQLPFQNLIDNGQPNPTLQDYKEGGGQAGETMGRFAGEVISSAPDPALLTSMGARTAAKGYQQARPFIKEATAIGRESIAPIVKGTGNILTGAQKLPGQILKTTGEKIALSWKPSKKWFNRGLKKENIFKYGLIGDAEDIPDMARPLIERDSKIVREELDRIKDGSTFTSMTDIIDKVRNKYGKTVGNANELPVIENLTNQYKNNYLNLKPNGMADPLDLQAYKVGLKNINFTNAPDPNIRIQSQFENDLYEEIKNEIEKLTGGKSGRLAEANKRLSEIIPILKAAEERMPTEFTNRVFSLNEVITTAGALASGNPAAMILPPLARAQRTPWVGKLLYNTGEAITPTRFTNAQEKLINWTANRLKGAGVAEREQLLSTLSKKGIPQEDIDNLRRYYRRSGRTEEMEGIQSGEMAPEIQVAPIQEPEIITASQFEDPSLYSGQKGIKPKGSIQAGGGSQDLSTRPVVEDPYQTSGEYRKPTGSVYAGSGAQDLPIRKRRNELEQQRFDLTEPKRTKIITEDELDPNRPFDLPNGPLKRTTAMETRWQMRDTFSPERTLKQEKVLLNDKKQLPNGIKKTGTLKTDEGNFSYYDKEKMPRDRAQYFTVKEDNDGWIVENVILPESERGKGIASKTYEYLNEQSLIKTGKPLVSTRPKTLSNGETITDLSKDGEKLWNRLVEKGLAKKTGDKLYEFKSDASSPERTLKQERVELAGVPESKLDNPKVIEHARKQWEEKGTESPYFKKWFGGSKVVDKSGKPLVVFHGSPDARFMKKDATFRNTRTGETKGAHWFTPSRATAKTYADDTRAWDYQNSEPDIIPAYLNMDNPLIIQAYGKNWREAQARGKTSDVIEEAIEKGHDGVIIKNVKDDYNNNARTQSTDTYLVFDSKQIKSATGNRGTFDPTDANINRQETVKSTTKGQSTKSDDGKTAKIEFGPDADVGTALHEFGHASEQTGKLSENDKNAFMRAMGLKKWDAEAQEKMEYGIEFLAREGNLPNEFPKALKSRLKEIAQKTYGKDTYESMNKLKPSIDKLKPSAGSKAQAIFWEGMPQKAKDALTQALKKGVTEKRLKTLSEAIKKAQNPAIIARLISQVNREYKE